MSAKFSYSIGNQIIPKYEQELEDSLPELYPNKTERSIVENVLIPQFRLKLEELFGEYLEGRKNGTLKITPNIPLTKYEIPDLCEAIETMIEENRQLFGENTLFKSVLIEIEKFRPIIKTELEEFSKQSFLTALKKNEITNRQSLLKQGPAWFQSQEIDFLVYGGSHKFFGKVLGRTVSNITNKILEEVADKLGFAEIIPLTWEEEKQNFLTILEKHGITDRQSLLNKGPTWFQSKKVDFPPYGKARAFLGKILGKTVYGITKSVLNEVADKLEFSETNNQNYLKILETHGITDRQSLINKGPKWFASKKIDFPPYGKGKAFLGKILGRTVYNVTKSVLNEVAEQLFPNQENPPN